MAAPSAAVAAVIRSLPDGTPAGPALAAPHLISTALAVLGAGPVSWARSMAHASTLVGEEYNGGRPDFPFQLISAANEDSLLRILTGLAVGTKANGEMTGARLEIVRGAAARGVPIDWMTGGMRTMQRHWTAALLDHAEEVGAGPDVIREIAVALAHAVDQEVDDHAQAYRNEAARLVQNTSPHRGQVVEALVDARPVPPDNVRHALGIRITDHHVALVLADGDDDPSAGHTARTLVRALDPRHCVEHERPGGQLWMWLSGSRPPDVAAALTAELGERAPVVGVGSVRSGADGFRRSHLEARDAAAFARRHGREPVVSYRDVALISLLGRDPDRAHWFVETHLRGLATDADPAAAELRETLSCYLRSGLRVVTAADRLQLHRNTLRHRLSRIESLLGREIVERTAELRCALLLAEELGTVRRPDR